MKTDRTTTDDLRISGSQFDKLMRKALQVAPGGAPKPKTQPLKRPASKAAKARKKP